MGLPRGTVSFVFTDIEASTKRWEADPEAMREALAHHLRIVQRCLDEHGGALVKGTGDGVFAAFDDAVNAVDAAVAIQRQLLSEECGGEEPLRVRMGLHTGAATPTGHDYFGPAVNKCARVMSAAWGGQILVSGEFRALLGSARTFVALGEHRLKDLAEPVELHQVLDAGLPAEFPPPRSLNSARTNLPSTSATFIGRELDLAEVQHLLHSHRVVTIGGPGGIGKTSLALHAAARAVDDHPAGVWFVDLAAVRDPDLVARAVGEAAGLADEPGRSWVETVSVHLAARPALVVLDNCEHVVVTVAQLVDIWLRRGDGVRFLATSRESLDVNGETVLRLSTFDVADDESSIESASATRLFLQRAAEAGAHIDSSSQSRRAIIEICRALDGLPLAIELAAARAPALPPVELASRLDDRFRVLGRGRRGDERHRTLEATVAWSYDLLDHEERLLFEQLSVFPSSFSLAAAEAVADGADPLVVLPELIERSLVELVPGPVARYRMLETLKSFGRRRAAERGTLRQDNERLLSWAVAFAEEARLGLDGSDQAPWLDRVAQELDNLRAAMAWAEDTGHPDGLTIAASLQRFWYVRSVKEGVTWLRRLLDTTPEAPDRIRAAALTAVGPLLHMVGAYAECADHMRLAIEVHERLGDDRGRAYSINYLGRALWGVVDRQEVRELFEESLHEMRRLDDRVGVVLNLLFLSTWHFEHGDVATAAVVVDENAALCRQLGVPHLMAHAAEQTGMAKVASGRADDAAGDLLTAIDLYQQIGNRTCAHHCLVNTAFHLCHVGDVETGLRLAAATECLQHDHGIVVPPYEDLYRSKVIAAAESLPPEVRAEAAGEGRSLPVDEALTLARVAVTRAAEVSRAG